jgi:hypothetical protein
MLSVLSLAAKRRDGITAGDQSSLSDRDQSSSGYDAILEAVLLITVPPIGVTLMAAGYKKFV